MVKHGYMRDHGKFLSGENHPYRRATHALTEKDAERFWSKVAIKGESECWEYQAFRNPKGYGDFGIGRIVRKAHRVAWALGNDLPLPDECVLHRCDNPPCCNPNHLFLGDRELNNQDMQEKGRQSSGSKHANKTRGSLHGRAVLTEPQVLSIRSRREAGERGADLAAEYGVSQSVIAALVYGKIWKHVGGPVRTPCGAK